MALLLDLSMNLRPRARPRVVNHGGKVHSYVPGKSEFENELWARLPIVARNAMLDGPLVIHVAAWICMSGPDGVRRLDNDNASKALLDGLVSARVISGDGHKVVKDLRMTLVEVGPDVTPRILVRISDYHPEHPAGAWWLGIRPSEATVSA